MALHYDLPVYKACYDLLLEIFKFTKEFTKEFKYTVGESLKKETLDLLTLIFRANSKTDKQATLQEARTRIEVVRLFYKKAWNSNLNYNKGNANRNNNNKGSGFSDPEMKDQLFRIEEALSMPDQIVGSNTDAGVSASVLPAPFPIVFCRSVPETGDAAKKRFCNIVRR